MNLSGEMLIFILVETVITALLFPNFSHFEQYISAIAVCILWAIIYGFEKVLKGMNK
jgi:hypothetical protein